MKNIFIKIVLSISALLFLCCGCQKTNGTVEDFSKYLIEIGYKNIKENIYIKQDNKYLYLINLENQSYQINHTTGYSVYYTCEDFGKQGNWDGDIVGLTDFNTGEGSCPSKYCEPMLKAIIKQREDMKKMMKKVGLTKETFCEGVLPIKSPGEYL